MHRPLGAPKELAQTILAVATVLLTVVACGARGSSDDPGSRPRFAGERERLLATCPAKAQDFSVWQQELAEKRGLRRPIDENDLVLDPVASVAQNYLLTLPADQRGGFGIDSVRDRIVVQVTRGEDEVLADLREKVDDPDSLTVEVVRWSEKDLATFADRLEALHGSDSWAYGTGNANGRMEVEVPGDADKARRKIAEVIDPCAFTVKGSVPSMRPS